MNIAAESSQRSAGYEVLSPWADIDPVPLRGISPRLPRLADQSIGLYSNGKRAAHLTLDAVERELHARFPGVKTSRYISSRMNSPEMLTEGKTKFEAWVRGVDAVVLSAGD